MPSRVPVHNLDPAAGDDGQVPIIAGGKFIIGDPPGGGGGGTTVGFVTTPEEHGAVGDGTTDDTDAIIAAIDACDTAGGGTVLFDAKTYLCNGPLRTDRDGNAVIPLPVGTRSPIQLVGVTPANNCDPRTDTGYTIIKTTKTGITYGSDGVPSLLGGPTVSPFVQNMVSLINICFWLPKNPTLSAVDMRYIVRLLWDGCSIQAINVGDGDYTQPTAGYTFGLRLPEVQNYHTVLIRSGQAHGMFAGIVGTTESLTLDYWVSKWCWIGWGITAGGHGASIGKMGLEWCAYSISGWSEFAGLTSIPADPFVGGTKAIVNVDVLSLEDSGGGWYNAVEHVHDPTDKLYGIIAFERYASGPQSTLTVNGGANTIFIPLLAPDLMRGGENLADLTDPSIARTNLGLGSAATEDVADFAPASHIHDAADVTSGTFDVDRLGTGTASAGQYVDGGTGAWTDLPTGGSSSGELLMQDGVTAPPVPLENEAQDDWLYQD